MRTKKEKMVPCLILSGNARGSIPEYPAKEAARLEKEGLVKRLDYNTSLVIRKNYTADGEPQVDLEDEENDADAAALIEEIEDSE